MDVNGHSLPQVGPLIWTGPVAAGDVTPAQCGFSGRCFLGDGDLHPSVTGIPGVGSGGGVGCLRLSFKLVTVSSSPKGLRRARC